MDLTKSHRGGIQSRLARLLEKLVEYIKKDRCYRDQGMGLEGI